MSSAVEPDARRAQQVNSARKKLKQFRASRTSHTPSPSHVSRTSSTSSGSGTVLNNSTADNTLPRRVPSSSHGKALLDAVADTEASGKMDTMSRHARQSSRHQRQRSSMTLSWPPHINHNMAPRPTAVGLFDVPPLEPSGESETKASDTEQSDTTTCLHEIVTTPATPTVEPSTLHTDREGAAVARLNSFSFGAKPCSNKPPLLPSFPIRESSPPKRLSAGRNHSVRLSRSSSPLDHLLEGSPRNSISSPNLNNRSTSPQPLPPSRRRHSHNRSESISLPNLKLGRPASLGLPSPGFPSTPSSPMGDVSSRSRLSTPQSLTPQSGSRLKFEPSDKEKEESRRRALDKLIGGGSCTPKAPLREEPRPAEISLPMFDDDDDDLSTTSSRPPSDALTSTASSSRPSSFTFGSSSSFNSLSASPLPWSQFEDNTERWSFGQSVGQGFAQRFDPKDDPSAFGSFGFDMSGPTKTSSVLLNSCSLGVLTEEDETESDADDEGTDMMSITSSVAETHETQVSTPAAPTPSRLRELHLVSSVSSQGSSNRRNSNPDVSRSLASARETPTKGGYGSIGRGRPRPLALDTSSASAFKAASATSPSKAARPSSLNLGRRPLFTRASSISYKKDDSGSGSSYDNASSRGITSPPLVTREIVSPPSLTSPLAEWTSMARGTTRPCPRPRSAILGTSGRVLGGVDEEVEDSSFRSYDDGLSTGRASTEASRNSYDGSLWPATARRDSRDRIDAELERDALREDVDLWRKRCRGLEEQVEAERREKHVYQDRARKLGDRLLALSAASSAMSPSKEREAAQDRLVAEMRDQLFNLTAALERERRERKVMVAHLAELQAALDGTRTPQVTPNSLPTTPKSRPRKSSIANMYGTPPEAQYADADFLDAMEDDEGDEEPESVPEGADNNWRRMRGFAFPQGPVEKMDRESKRDSFFGLSRPRAVRAAPSIGGLGLDWATSPTEHGFDLPPIEVNAGNRDLIRPASVILKTKAGTRTLREREERERAPDCVRPRSRPPAPTRPLPPIDTTPERQTPAPAGGFGLGFLSGYLPIPRTTPPMVPRVLVTPSSVSPKRAPRPLEREMMTHHVVGAVGDIDMRHSCRRCTGEIIEL